jgi:hypothetical protein
MSNEYKKLDVRETESASSAISAEKRSEIEVPDFYELIEE